MLYNCSKTGIKIKGVPPFIIYLSTKLASERNFIISLLYIIIQSVQLVINKQGIKGTINGAMKGSAFGPIGAVAGAALGLGSSFLDDF